LNRVHESPHPTDPAPAPAPRRLKAYLAVTAPLLLLIAAALAGCLPARADSPQTASAARSAATAVSANATDTRYLDELFSVVVEEDIEYGTAPALEGAQPTSLTLDLYRPEADAATLRPAIIWVHGGGFAKGDKGDKPAAFMSEQFAKMGYVAASINYRLLDGGGCSAANGVSPDCFRAGVEAVRDAQAAVRWLRANAPRYGIDVERIAIAGESAGGIVAAGVGVSSDLATDGSNPGYSSAVRAWISISGGLPGGIFVDSSDAAGLLFAGTDDNVVPYQWSVETADAMAAAGVPAVLETLPDAGHVPWREYGDFFQQASRGFLYDQLDLSAAPR
jgi:acetyl esterase/lipase